MKTFSITEAVVGMPDGPPEAHRHAEVDLVIVDQRVRRLVERVVAALGHQVIGTPHQHFRRPAARATEGAAMRCAQPEPIRLCRSKTPRVDGRSPDGRSRRGCHPHGSRPPLTGMDGMELATRHGLDDVVALATGAERARRSADSSP
jgi:hypothetical protein